MSDARDNDDLVDFEEGGYSEMEDEVEEKQVEEYEEEEEEDNDDEDGDNPNADEHDVEDYGDTRGGYREEGEEELVEHDDDDGDNPNADEHDVEDYEGEDREDGQEELFEEEDDDDEDGDNPNADEHDVEDYGYTRGGYREEGEEELVEDYDNHIDIETADDEDYDYHIDIETADDEDYDNHIDIETAEDEEKSASPVNEERERFSYLLSLPPHGSEVFIGGLSRDVGEEDLRDLCEEIGEIFEVTLVKDRDSGDSKGYAFVAFKTKDVAQKAIEELHSKEFKGKTIRCSLSETKNRLFIGNIPKSLAEDEFIKVIEDVGPGVENIELAKDQTNSTRNRGFAFVLYHNNACADYSRQKMIDSNFKLDGNAPTVTWADPKSSPEYSAAAAAQVKALYVKNIPENTSTEQLKELFQRHGEVTKVVTPPGKGGKRDFGFVHYAERSSALKAVKDTERYEINGQPLEVVLAKPQAERKHDSSYSYGAAATPAPFVYPTFGGFAAPPYGAMGSGLGIAGSFNQPMIYGSGAMPTGMQMVPMLLPDGQFGYVLQQPGMQMARPPRPRRFDRNNRSSRGSGRGNSHQHYGKRGGRRYRPY